MSSQDDPAASNALKYMLLCKVVLNTPEDVMSLLSIKLAVRYARLRKIESMPAIALAHQNRNLTDFEKALRYYRHVLYDTLLLQNLLHIVEPYSVVEINYVAKQVVQGRQGVEAKIRMAQLLGLCGRLTRSLTRILKYVATATSEARSAGMAVRGEVVGIIGSTQCYNCQTTAIALWWKDVILALHRYSVYYKLDCCARHINMESDMIRKRSPRSILCTEPFCIPSAGRFDICFFDTTGTITAENLVLEGVVGMDESDKQKLMDVEDTSKYTTLFLAAAHALVRPDDGTTSACPP
ncbi:hypothetical protein AZE42_13194 [Rhizopogon vesiculosus]|uniref:Uncharacterized protein n=1 Tax=Rhizopogon vesiculosus TaxID=180088 RepID=A0A1J8QLB9_9AGAM|nr:hypothetical protein AZE42_13194 [Rhizopogon vesiculosus]